MKRIKTFTAIKGPSTDTVLDIDNHDLDYEVVVSTCQTHCKSQTDLKAFIGLKRKSLFSYSCICLPAAPGDNDIISKLTKSQHYFSNLSRELRPCTSRWATRPP